MKIFRNSIYFRAIGFCIFLLVLVMCKAVPDGIPKGAYKFGDIYKLQDKDENGNVRLRHWSESGILVEVQIIHEDKIEHQFFNHITGKLIDTKYYKNYSNSN